ncbi:MAG: hypothetical protein KAJ12_03815 [Bacteroidetes bacterium]|nr:hypothetical protein [Bacteroidota bacterium]
MGKAAVVYVIGLSLIIGIGLANINQSSVGSMDTYSTYFGRTMAHNIALAAANIGTNKILFSGGFSSTLTGTFGGGKYKVSYSDTGSADTFTKFMTVESLYNAGGGVLRDTVKAVFQRITFARYAWFTEKEVNGYIRPNGKKGPYFGYNDWKITGDSVWGYAHTNYKFNLAGRPYFHNKVTATNAATLMKFGGEMDPIYNEGYEWGVNIKRDTANIGVLRTLSNAGSPFAPLMANNDVGLEFFANGTAHLEIPYGTGALVDTVVPMGQLTSSGVIGVYGGDLHIKGTYRGKYTVAAFTGTGATKLKGNVWIDGDVLANDSPRGNPSSKDMLGIVAERMGYITKDPSRTLSSTLYIDAAMYCHNGEFTAEDFWVLPKSGRVSLFGSLVQQSAGSLGVFSMAGLQNGMYYSIRHDPRFLALGPPKFPYSTKYRLVAWWEG